MPADRPDKPTVDEFDVIARLMRPLTLGAPEALDLLDDAAVLTPRPDEDLVISADMMVEGVHFLAGDPIDQVAQRLLRTNLSDLAAKAAQPYAYFLSIAWPPRCGWAERQAFAQGLERDQRAYGLKLLGGDSVSTPGPLTASVTILGRTPPGRAVLRSGARAGDVVLVSGWIGDGWLGLQAALEGRTAPSLTRYRTPEPRVALTPALRAWATAAADVSDGLIADAGHIAAASALGVELDLDAVPLSAEGRAFADHPSERQDRLLRLAAGGDDYEVVLTSAPENVAAMIEAARAAGVAMTPIGRMVEGRAVRVLFQRREIRVNRAGYRHG
ncbi:MAG TPA: thiamine-phosphate kinase [Caulobacteraceae bacterium]|nr:thiamine-phosphate kinase [Caulobacteraceae bacterium]